MTKARISVLGLLAGAGMLYGCATDDQAASALTHAANASAIETASAAMPATIDNFMLPDETLMGHELYRLADAKAIVIITQANGCPISRSLAPAVRELKAKYEGKGVEFLMLNSALQDSREAIAKEAAEYNFDVPVLLDSNQLVGEQLGVTRTGEFFVIDPKTWKVVFRGPLDDRRDYGVQKAVATHSWTADAIDATLAGRPALASTKASPGCLIDFPERAKKAQHTKISYANEVAPILEAKCVSCHQPGSIGPFSMTSYEMVKGFSPMIREVIRTDRMPPWNASPHVGKFKDDKDLTKAEIKTLVHWIEAGAPRGDGPDPLAKPRPQVADWPLGKPDLILDIPSYKIPASGVVDYQRPWVANPLTEGKWIKASTYKIGSRQGVHHYLSGYVKPQDLPKPGEQANEMRWGAGVGGYAVGADSTFWPTNVGTYLPPGGGVAFQAHYTPYGKEELEKSQIGIYFYKDNELPELMMRSTVVVDNTIVIPAGAARHKETAYVEFPKEALLYSAFPHAHYRGYASDLWIHYPDGTKKMLLSMPRYDFNWQREYTFAEPVKVPAGAKIVAHYWYDNSKRNPANPDPTKEIVWGDQSFEEMFYTALRYRWIDETAKKQVAYDEEMNQTRMLGMLDDNLDGKLQKAELKGQFGKQLASFFGQIDRDSSGAIEKAELAAVQQMLFQRRRQAEQQQQQQAASPGGRR
ncbi:redoxin family protein [Phenylobacterium sp. J426]|uniref:redoxin family protein n=1 Tax=Phenylobacterium sp. J426 TaxID=2898439 RepID=UPI00215144B8|nr:redoxin family protein [Phenylobacterium sp. J426]MCR5874149.1 redoxin family protein [Phenylobacterium sp. J426]